MKTKQKQGNDVTPHTLRRLGAVFSKAWEVALRYKWPLTALLVLVGVALRFAVSFTGSNYDLQSYALVAEITDRGGNVYAETFRYNYGPIWLNVIHVFDEMADLFAAHYEVVFRCLLVGLLTTVDLAIAYLLYRRFSLGAGIIFFLNPISIVLSGYHNQFDNLAVFVGLLSMLLFHDAIRTLGGKLANKKMLVSLVLLGVSLTVKHIFFLLPLWLAFRQVGWRRKFLVLAAPIMIFLVSFVPYMAQGWEGIRDNVFLYESRSNAPLLNFALPGFVSELVEPKFLMFGGLLAIGLWARRFGDEITMALYYTLFLVVLTPAVANQYFAIVMPAVAVFFSWAFVPFVLLASVLLWVTSVEGVASGHLANITPDFLESMVTRSPTRGQYEWVMLTLTVGLVYLLAQQKFNNLFVWVYRSVRDEAIWQWKSFRS